MIINFLIIIQVIMRLFKNITNSYYDRVDRITRKKESIERKLYVHSIDFDADLQIKKMIEDALKTNYLDIFVYEDRIQAAGSTFYFQNYGKEDIHLDEAKKLAIYIKGKFSKSRYDYRIQPLYDFSGGGATGGYYGLNQSGSVEWFSGSSSGDKIVGWRIHNENYNVSTGIFKEWNSELHRYRLWDVKNCKYLN